ncbi:MAG: DUF5060 domain-containing protein [Bryobacteraceae bacterium]|nr:DUF5060 domain-containing protein [Bryobacteraceae bacterium]
MRTRASSALKACLAAAVCLTVAAPSPAKSRVEGELKRWHTVTVTFDGPRTAEDATPNPFRDYRLNVTFTHTGSGKSYVAPGFFAADGKAAESSAVSGNQWRVRFTPDAEGEWKYVASFRSGADVAISLDPDDGEAAAFDGESGSFRVGPSDKTGADHRAKGLLRYVDQHHLRFAGSGEYFLKGGADSPENFLAYADFDDTYDADADSGSYKAVGTFIHRYEPHVRDWRRGDPTWKGGKGKGIVGALNYLASKGVNSVYFITYNLDGGDGRDTWMWTGVDVRDRYDVSKLDQWEIVLSHMDRKGIMLHVVTQETENDRALGGGPGLNPIRKLYYRELCARFSHHLALIWNLGEENNTPDKDRKEIAAYIRSLDPYRHPITVHTHNDQALTFYDGLLGDPNFEATSIQGAMQNYNREAIELRRRSAAAGRKWAIFGDEQSRADTGVVPDSVDPAHDIPRIEALWGNLMGGGSGVEWYFGSSYPHMDINCEDFRSRDAMWDQTRRALEFFRKHLPFWEMAPDNSLVSGVKDGRALARGDSPIAVQLPTGGEASLKLGPGTYAVRWYNPRAGGELQTGSVPSVQGPGVKPIGSPPAEPGKDWVALVAR